MIDSLQILFVASEMVPFAKTGGLADVVGALPRALKERGHDVRVVIPLYRSINLDDYSVNYIDEPFYIPMGGDWREWCRIVVTELDGIPVYFTESERFFGRDGIYHDAYMNDFGDNPLRFAFLSKAALQICDLVSFAPDVIHVHDWQTAIIPAFIQGPLRDSNLFRQTGTVLTIHNMAYQGMYGQQHYRAFTLPLEFFRSHIFEAYGNINMLKGGIFFSDVVTTVSPNYAREVLTPEFGYGLSKNLIAKGRRFVGVLNGVDYSVWSPESDSLIPANYSIDDLSGKKKCRRELQKLFHLNADDHIAIIASIGRFVSQKGFHLISEAIGGILNNMHCQFVILGSGDKELENFFRNLPARFSGQVGSYIGYSDELAHLIEAGADMFLMPSLFEPCGLNQIYSLRYGTLPIVRATGGLDDTVINYNEYRGSGTGFKFWDKDAQALYYAVGWAISTYYDRVDHFRNMQQMAMEQDFSWEKSCRDYETIYDFARRS